SIELALKYDKKNKYFYLLASNIYASLNQLNKATLALETMMKEVKGTEEYLYELAALYMFDKKDEEALKTYNRAESMMGIDETSSAQKQRIYLDQGKTEEAIREAEKLAKAYPDEERYALGFAELLTRTGQTQKAIAYVESFIIEHPDAGNSKMMLAGLYRDAGQESKSRTYVAQVFDDASVNVNSKVVMLSTYANAINNNRNKKINDVELETYTIDLFKKLEANYPTNSDVHLIGGDLYLMLEENDAAALQFLKAIRGGNSSFDAWQNLLYLDAKNNKPDSLIKHSEEALELFPNQAMVYYFNGLGHLQKKHYREGAYSLEQAKRLSTQNPSLVGDINAMLGDAYQGTKEYAKSNSAYEAALSYDPDNDVVLNNYSYYLALRKENLDKAEKMSTQLIKLYPDNASYLDTHAWVLYAREKYKEARKVIEKAISVGNPSSTHLEHYGDILFQLGEIDLAVKQWQNAKQKDENNTALDKKISNRKLN
ncbi:MAG: tetratricopeptide repeat protein, partial [Cyclobacteriaceae bacterium]|nr:tetratricopeptide repeat protein [Cyclobacteriaceae bacterium]